MKFNIQLVSVKKLNSDFMLNTLTTRLYRARGNYAAEKCLMDI